MDTSQKLTHLSLCAGYGGIDLGLSRVFGDLEPVAYVEIEAFAAFNLVTKIEEGELPPGPIWTNLKTFPWEHFRERVGLLSGGFPCQPFSSTGQRKADSDPRHLWPYIREGIRVVRPALVFLENVEGILSAKLKGDQWADPAETPVALHVLRELERLGYSAEAGVFSAAEVGAPHQRKRVLFLALSNSLTDRHRGWLADKIRSPLGWSGQSISEGWQQQAALSRDAGAGHRWPARTGCEQFEWEPPRKITIKSQVG